jgi:pilus assembly protein CpaB
MSRRRRAAVLLGLALLLGGLAASDVAGREAALRRGLGPTVGVVVARTAIPSGGELAARRLAIRRVPARYAPDGTFTSPSEVRGLRAAVAIPQGADLDASVVGDGRGEPAAPGPPVRPGERLAQVVAVAPAEEIGPGSRVDVLVTRAGSGGGGSTRLALEDAEVLSAQPAAAPAGDGPDAGLPRVALGLRVTVRQAVYLAAAQSFAREIRVLARAPGDRRHSAAGLSVSERL